MTTPSDRVRQLLAELNDAVVAATSEAWAGVGWQPPPVPTTRRVLIWTTAQRALIAEWGFHRLQRRWTFVAEGVVDDETIIAWHELPPPPKAT